MNIVRSANAINIGIYHFHEETVVLGIHVVAPARWVEQSVLDAFQNVLSARADQFNQSKQVTEQCGQLAGRDEVRAAALNEALQAKDVDIIWAARGGYGAMRTLPLLSASPQKSKIFIGYSDMCALEFGALGASVHCVHGAMPIDCAADKSSNVLKAFAFSHSIMNKDDGRSRVYDLEFLRAGQASGSVYAANLAVLMALVGTPFEPDLPHGAILCLEDVGEYLYALDRLFWRLSQSPLAARLGGVVLGDFTDLEDNPVPWGEGVEQMALRYFSHLPVASGLPIGHGERNEPILQGERGVLIVTESGARLELTGDK